VNESALEVVDLTVRFGGLVAVDNVSLEAPEGKLTGLIGPNGAGKTTIFNACSGLVRPAEGGIRMFKEDVSHLGPPARARRGLGRTFQRIELWDSLSVAQNVALGREALLAGRGVIGQLVGRRGEQRDVAKAADDAMELCGISGMAERQAGVLSTGDRRLVELARAVAGDFRILLLDEPSSGLDYSEASTFGAVLREVARRGPGVLLVEHNMAVVMEVCEYIYVLDFGKLIFKGTPEEVAASDEVRAAYLGSEAA
jgi:ABC-type branched-subunit amino acid transport system ATPase component